MNLNTIKKLLGSSAVLGCVVSAMAQPPVTTIPAGLDPLGPQFPTPNGGSPVSTGEELFSSGGDVTVTFLGPTGAGYDEQLFVSTPANSFGFFFDNHATANGLTYDLGSYPLGTEIEFGLDVLTTGNTWYDGPGTRNGDGDVHAYMVNNYEGLPNTTYVGFEDEDASIADWNYVDEVYAFTGASAAPSVPDASSGMALLGLSLTGLGCFGRRFRK